MHLWDRATDPQPWIEPATMAAIDRDFGLTDLDRMLAATGMDAAVLVQSSNSLPETRRLLAHRSARVAGVVGWIDLTIEPDRQLDTLDTGGFARLVGLRHLVHLDPDPGWLDRPEVTAALIRAGARGLGFDLVVRAGQLAAAAALAARCADVRLVVDHLGGIAEAGDPRAWALDLRELARRPNTWAKLSGLAGADPLRVRQAFDVALEVFGPDRLMYGSDWPVAELGRGAFGWRVTVDALLARLSRAEREAILSGTGSAFYRIGR
ncbi:amidohydrolase [Actinoplanes sp. L3-i22]|uniref:amidohydrolase family protein n=1 Tax=Actinoplanes sp. L3-i22 TaxID=2836373 RepID=UPI002101D903|nr:amidohydrolase family protein [Actinoplanes sp. L3-i22]